MNKYALGIGSAVVGIGLAALLLGHKPSVKAPKTVAVTEFTNGCTRITDISYPIQLKVGDKWVPLQEVRGNSSVDNDGDGLIDAITEYIHVDPNQPYTANNTLVVGHWRENTTNMNMFYNEDARLARLKNKAHQTAPSYLSKDAKQWRVSDE